MVDVFVSYASDDRDRVRPLVERLAAEGWSVWWDRHIGSGAAWDAEIEKALEDAGCAVVVWSEASVKSEWVRTEAVEALEGCRLVPMMLDDVKVPLRFRRVQARKLNGWPVQHDPMELEQLLADVAGKLKATPRRPRHTVLDLERSEQRAITLVRVEFVAAEADNDDPEAIDEWAQVVESRIRDEV
jgi:hypothetical protein